MANNQNGRNQFKSEDHRTTFRPHDSNVRDQGDGDDHDDQRSMSDRDRDRDRSRTSTDHYGQGQSGYGAGRVGDDRSLDMENRNQSYGGRFQDRQEGTDDRFSGRGGAPYYPDRGHRGPNQGSERGFGGAENRGYDSGYNQGGSGYGGMDVNGDRYGNDQRFQSDRTRGNRDMERGMDRSHDFASQQHSPYRGGYGGSSEQRHTGFRNSESFSSQGGGQGGYGAHLRQGRQGGYGQHGSTQSGFGREFRGPHRGKGPAGWQRSDERIRELVCEVLSDDEHIDATHIDVIVSSGEVTLMGSVPDRSTKRLAEDAVEQVTGVKDIQNQLKIGDGNKKETEPTPSKHRA